MVTLARGGVSHQRGTPVLYNQPPHTHTQLGASTEPLLSKLGTYQTVNAIFWPWRSGRNRETLELFPHHNQNGITLKMGIELSTLLREST